MKLGAEFILGVIFLPAMVTAFLWIVDLQKADAIQMTKLEHLIDLTEEIRSDVKELKK